MATVRMPSSWADRNTRIAISLRLATKSFVIFGIVPRQKRRETTAAESAGSAAKGMLKHNLQPSLWDVPIERRRQRLRCAYSRPGAAARAVGKNGHQASADARLHRLANHFWAKSAPCA